MTFSDVTVESSAASASRSYVAGEQGSRISTMTVGPIYSLRMGTFILTRIA
jgi:hypothetical protein